jgi:hypothetical protein
MPRRLLTCRQLAQRAEVALKALELGVTTRVGTERIALVWSGLRALDDEQCAIKDRITELLDSLDTGYTVPEVIEDLRELVKAWEAAAKSTKRAEKWRQSRG